MFVGVGPARVRIRAGEDDAALHIFIDEIDAVGRQRGKGGITGGSDERENTLNQVGASPARPPAAGARHLLTPPSRSPAPRRDGRVRELGRDRRDGEDQPPRHPRLRPPPPRPLRPPDPNRPARHHRVRASPPAPPPAARRRRLPPALPILPPSPSPLTLPPLTSPSRNRAEIFASTSRSSSSPTTSTRSRRRSPRSPGFSGAEVANVCNEGALVAAREQGPSRCRLSAAADRVIGGLERKSKVLSEEDRTRVAHHEAGHAVTGWF